MLEYLNVKFDSHTLPSQVCASKIIMSKPHYCTKSIIFIITCEPCPSKVSKWHLDGDMLLGIDLIKNEKRNLNKKQLSVFTIRNVIIFNFFTFENVEYQQTPSYNADDTTNCQPFLDLGMVLYTYCEPLLANTQVHD